MAMNNQVHIKSDAKYIDIHHNDVVNINISSKEERVCNGAITEDHVDLQIAKLLNEKGFNEQTDYIYYYYESDDDYCFEKLLPTDRFNKDVMLHCPTTQMAMKWLREVHNLCIEPYRTACGYLYTISKIWTGSCIANPSEGGDDEDSGQWTTYEGACEAAIKYCLENLI